MGNSSNEKTSIKPTSPIDIPSPNKKTSILNPDFHVGSPIAEPWYTRYERKPAFLLFTPSPSPVIERLAPSPAVTPDTERLVPSLNITRKTP